MTNKPDKIFEPEPGLRLKRARIALKLKQDEFGAAIGRSRNTIVEYEKGRAEIPGDIIEMIKMVYNVNPHWLRTGEGNMFVKVLQSKDTTFDVQGTGSISGGYAPGEEPPEHEPELAEVHIVNNGLGGEGGYDVYEQVPIEEQVPLKTIKLPKELVGDCRQAIEVRGDSMFPTLKDGDYVGVDTSDKALIPGELYLIRSRYFVLIVKRLEDADPGIMVKSDNPVASSRVVPEDRLEEEVNVIGRIAWIFGTRKPVKKG